VTNVTIVAAADALACAAARHSLSRPGASIEQITNELVGLHNTSPAGPYLSVRARFPGFDRADLASAMWDHWDLARLRAMRLTMFVFTRELLSIAAGATRHLTGGLAARWLRDSGLTEYDFDQLADAVEAALAEGPMTVRDLRRNLDVAPPVDLPGVVSRMCDAGRLVGGAPPRSWRSSVRRYHRWADVLPGVDLHAWREEVAITELIRRYVRSYGPVTVSDISWWTGFTKEKCRTALASLAEDVEEVAVEGWPGPLFRIGGGHTGEEFGDTVHALPLLDPYVQGYRERARFLDPALLDYVYDGGGNSTATLVHRGRIIGVWQATDQPTESIRYHLFADQPGSLRRAAETDLVAAGALYFDASVDVIEVSNMQPLSAGGGRSASHPLDEQLHRVARRRQETS